MKHLLEGKTDLDDEVVEVQPSHSFRKFESPYALGKRVAENQFESPRQSSHGAKPGCKENKTSGLSKKERIKELENRYHSITQKCSSIDLRTNSGLKGSASSLNSSLMKTQQPSKISPPKAPLGTLNANLPHLKHSTKSPDNRGPEELSWSPASSLGVKNSEETLETAKPTVPAPEVTISQEWSEQLPTIAAPAELNQTQPEPELQIVEQTQPAVKEQLPEPKQFTRDPETNLSYRAYSVTTHNGKVRSYNEDRVSIIQRIYLNSNQGIPTSFFGLFDGHCGVSCANYLRDKLHHFVTKHPKFATDKPGALKEGILQCEGEFLSQAAASAPQNPAGSCAIVCMISNNSLLLANVGDSRAILSLCRGKQTVAITEDHKPGMLAEKNRIFAAGGYIAKSKKQVSRVVETADGRVSDLVEDVTFGPYRVFPGGFSVSRSIGDLPAKKHAGPKSMIADPDIFSQEITPDHDFLVMASDGVFDVLGNEEIVSEIWNLMKLHLQRLGLKETCKLACERITQLAMQQDSSDNITVVVIAFQPVDYYLEHVSS